MQSVTQDYTDRALFDGDVWRMQRTETVAASTTVYVGFITGAAAVALMDRIVTTDGNDAVFQLHEDTTYTGGAASSLLNRNRTSAAASPFSELKTGVTPGTLGTAITGVRLKGRPNDPFIQSSAAAKIIMKPNTSHVLAMQNLHTATSDLDVFALFARLVAFDKGY